MSANYSRRTKPGEGSLLFRKHASPDAIRAEIRKAREEVRLAKKALHSLEVLLEIRESEIADGTWPGAPTDA